MKIKTKRPIRVERMTRDDRSLFLTILSRPVRKAVTPQMAAIRMGIVRAG